MQTPFVVPGYSTICASIPCAEVTFFEKRIEILPSRQADIHWLRYFGPRINWGSERHAVIDLAPIASRLADSVEACGRPVSVAQSLKQDATLWDLNGPTMVTEQKFSECGMRVEYLGSTPPAIRALIEQRGENRRAVLKNEDMEKERLIIPSELLRRLGDSTLVIDHLGSPELAITLSLHARTTFSNLDGFPARSQAQIAFMSDLSVCTLPEFVSMASATGIGAPDTEARTPNLRGTASAMLTFREKASSGDLVVTLGSHGVLALSKGRRGVIHFAPNFTPQQYESLSRYDRLPRVALFASESFFVRLIQTWEPNDLAGAVICAMALDLRGLDCDLEFRASQMHARVFKG